MTEFSLAEVFLLFWALGATFYNVYVQHQLSGANMFIHALLHQEGLHADIVKRMKEKS